MIPPIYAVLLFDGAVPAPLFDRLRAVAQIGEDFIGVLAQFRRQLPDRSGSGRELDRDSDLFGLLAGGSLRLDDHVALPDLGIMLNLVQGQHRSRADISLAE